MAEVIADGDIVWAVASASSAAEGGARAMRLEPVGKRLLVDILPLETETTGGILLPETVTRDRPPMGRVLAVGETADFSIGEVVFFGKYAGMRIRVDGADRLILQCDEIIGRAAS